MTLVRSNPPRQMQPDAATIRYDDDQHGWALQHAALLRAGRTDALDLENIADEIADVAGRDDDKLESALTRVFQHLLKWDHRPERRSRSWVLGIKEHRARATKLLRKHPGLKSALSEIVADGYSQGRYQASIETDRPEAPVPAANPYSWTDTMARDITWREE